MVLDLAALPVEQPDIAGLLQRLNGRGVRIIGTEGAHPSWQGLEAWAPLHANSTRPPRAVDVPDERHSGIACADHQQETNGLLIDHPVRSGQSVVFRERRRHHRRLGRVRAPKSLAGGSIHVYGALRGRAIAGLPQQRAPAFSAASSKPSACDRRPLSDGRRYGRAITRPLRSRSVSTAIYLMISAQD